MKKGIGICFMLFHLTMVFGQEKEIRGVIDKMFSAMYKADTAVLRTCFTPGATLVTHSYDSKGNPRVKGEGVSDFLRGIGKMGEADMEEKLTGWQCLIDEGMASVWTPYEFYFEGKYSHCGVNSFQLVWVQGDWKISMITDTRRKTNCVRESEMIAQLDSMINEWHRAAARADADAFFGRMSPGCIYIGTDAGERWLRDELKEWSKKYFERESAWDFTPLSRNFAIGPGEQIAWFDELLDTWMGTCRSTGIMEKLDGDWKIVYYHLSVALPNEKLDEYRVLIGKT